MSLSVPFSYSRLRVWQLVYLVALSAWYIKFFVLIYVYNNHIGLPFVEHSLLQGLMLSPYVSIVAYMIPLMGGISLVYMRRCWAMLASIVLMGASLVMLWNIHSYNDATFVVTFWVAAWLLWWATRVNSEDKADARWAVRLGLGIISLIFFGGAVGKWTEGYWSGEVVYQLYFMQKEMFVYVWMRENLDQVTLEWVACWFSRMLIFIETLWATLFLWPVRLACSATILLAVFMIIGSTWMLYSVLGGVIGLSMAGYVIRRCELGNNCAK